MQQFETQHLSNDLPYDELINLAREYYSSNTVLGLDIYQYSNFLKEEQFYIPVLFDILYNAAIENVLLAEPFFFQFYGNASHFKENFISTGDGGYQIFQNPIQAVLFANIFQAGLKAFNADRIQNTYLRNIKMVIEGLDLRYAISTGLLYRYNENFFGPPIINNSRMMSKDKLNRLLFDQSTVDWLVKVIDTPENIMLYNKSSFNKLEYFKKYNSDLKSTLFNKTGNVLTFDVLKIGDIKAKDKLIGVFNVYIQSLVKWNNDLQPDKPNELVVSLGNLNTSGIE